MKKILLFVLFITALTVKAQNSMSIVAIPPQTTQGATFDLVFEYTSETAGNYEIQLMPMNADGQPVWSMPNAFYTNAAIAPAATATQVTVSVVVPASITLAEDLPAPAVGWGIFGKITDGSADTAFLPTYPTINITASSTEAPAATISIVTFPSEVAKGSTFDVVFEYTSNFVGVYELQIMPLDLNGQPVWSMGNSFYASDAIAVNAEATQVTVPITLPEDITLSSDLQEPALAWGLFGKIAKDTEDVAYLAPYPKTSVVATLGVRNNIFDTTTIFYNASKNTLEVNVDNINADVLKVYDVRGALVMDIKNVKTNSSIDVSSLSNGMYIVRSDSKFLKFVK